MYLYMPRIDLSNYFSIKLRIDQINNSLGRRESTLWNPTPKDCEIYEIRPLLSIISKFLSFTFYISYSFQIGRLAYLYSLEHWWKRIRKSIRIIQLCRRIEHWFKKELYKKTLESLECLLARYHYRTRSTFYLWSYSRNFRICRILIGSLLF